MKRTRSFLERGLLRFSTVLQDSLFAEEIAGRNGRLQKLDPRIKIAGSFLLVFAVAFSHSTIIVALLLAFSLLLAATSGIFQTPILRRLWFLIPLYTAFIALPSLFLTPGEVVWSNPGIPITITAQGIKTAVLLVLRTSASVSFLLGMVLTTSWPVFLRSLRGLGFPRTLVVLITMTYRFIFVLLLTATQLFLGRRSRQIGPEDWRTTGRWTGLVVGTLLEKSYHLSQEVFLAMQARGYRGEPVMMQNLKITKADLGWLLFVVSIAALSIYFRDLQ